MTNYKTFKFWTYSSISANFKNQYTQIFPTIMDNY